MFLDEKIHMVNFENKHIIYYIQGVKHICTVTQFNITYNVNEE